MMTNRIRNYRCMQGECMRIFCMSIKIKRKTIQPKNQKQARIMENNCERSLQYKRSFEGGSIKYQIAG